MSHSLRAKIKCLRYKGIITDKDCDRLCNALDNEDVLDKIRTEIENATSRYIEYKNDDRTDTEKYAAWWELDKEYFLRIIDKYRIGSNETQTNEIVYDIGGHMYGAMGGDVIMDILAGKGKE